MTTPASESEWRLGWRIVLGCALASGTGVALLFFTFSLFLLPIANELGATRGELSLIQALVVTAALGSPIIGRLTDIYGFKAVFYACTAIVAATQVAVAALAGGVLGIAIGVAMIGFFGVGSTAVAVTRPVSWHFREHRGKALGLVAVGVSLTTIAVPPLLQLVTDSWGWRGGFVALAAISVTIGVPAVALLLPPTPGLAGSGIGRKPAAQDWSFFGVRDFWGLTIANLCMNLATAGAVSQMSPMIQEEGISAPMAALALSLFASGQFVGRLAGGWLLDRFDPRLVAVALTILPGSGFLILLFTAGAAPAALAAVTMIGVQQGAEHDIVAYFTASRFDVARYGTIFGAVVGIGWFGSAAGIIGAGQLHDLFGSYSAWQAVAATALLAGASLILTIRLPARGQAGESSAA
ncbi:MAG TPA: MFS transporter [Novosphingobium sp.]|jgi:predicted MFS family arabinose efflux permease|nr:MFS transporter [Novosphingobium sp.]HPB21100.1 MFS transporter [Novosphingobium sp.]HPZ46860.1 MFS transporter [Novosphingobium sp.]HQD98875.1 MFS transporter [Novosphingobium sp.]